MQCIMTLTKSEKLKSRLEEYAERFTKEGKVTRFVFTDDYAYFKNKKGGVPVECYDAVLIDTSAGTKGFESADDLRKIDKHMPVVFIESGAKKIGIGYVFNAVAYITYDKFSYAVFKIVFSQTAEMRGRERDRIAIRNNDGLKMAYFEDIMYLEIAEHTLTVHLTDEDVSCRGSLKTVSDNLVAHGFCYLSRNCMVNLRYVSRVSGDEVTIKDGKKCASLEISKGRKKNFMDEVDDFFNLSGSGSFKAAEEKKAEAKENDAKKT